MSEHLSHSAAVVAQDTILIGMSSCAQSRLKRSCLGRLTMSIHVDEPAAGKVILIELTAEN